MKLLFYDKFFESLIALPKGIQKKVVDFQRKFRENSKSLGIHLEPIAATKDKTLKSARIDQTYRAIIKVPESGDIYYLLWVDHHDKAYNWASSKVFQWNDVTQSMQMFSAPEIIEEKSSNINHKSEEKNFFEKFSDEQLIRIGVPEVLLPSIKKINSIDDLEDVEKFIPPDTFENLFYLMDGANIDQLIFEIEEGKVEDDNIEVKVSSINNQRSFIELTDDELLDEILKDGMKNKWKYYLHPSQRKLVNGNFKGSVKITGGAGTGKTVAAIHRLKYLSERRKPSEKILFTTFTKVLTENIKQLINGLRINMDNITISNLDELVFKLVRDLKLFPENFKIFEFSSVKSSIEIWEDVISSELTPLSPEFLEAEYIDVKLYHNVNSLEEYLRTSRVGRGKPISRRQRKEIWRFFEVFNNYKHQRDLYYKSELYNALNNYLDENEFRLYDYCLVDELQDFSNVELRVIRSLTKVKENDLFMVGDPMQKIYEKVINFSKIGISVRGKRSRRLRINYRTTEEIKKLALSVINDCHYDNFDGEEEIKAGYVSLFHGNKPSYNLFKTKNEETEYVLNKINELIESGSKYEDIAICSRIKDGLKDFRNILHENNILFSDNSNDKTPGYDAISLLTFHKIKGLEFKNVFLVDVNDRSVPKLPYYFKDMDKEEQQNYLKNEKSLIYVALTRAVKNVFITGVGAPSKIINI